MLKTKIEDKSARIGIIGIGYVGLPLAGSVYSWLIPLFSGRIRVWQIGLRKLLSAKYLNGLPVFYSRMVGVWGC